MNSWHLALRSLRPSLIAFVWMGAFVLAVLGILWLQIPDSHIWQFGFSMLSALGLLGLFFWFCCQIFTKMVKPAEEGRWWFRWILLAAVIVVWWLLQLPIDKLVERSELYAGYWTSRLPHGLRWLRTYIYLILLQNWTYFSLRLLATGLLLPVAVIAGAGRLRDDAGRVFRAWSRWWYWAAVLVCGWVAFSVSGKLMNWTPGHGLAGELFSLLGRLGIVFTLDVLLACFVLSVAVIGLRNDTAAAVE
jgi:hypothetical protein